MREVLRSPPASFESHDDAGDEPTWAGEGLLAQFLLVRSEDGVLRSVEAGLTSTGPGEYAADLAALGSSLLELAERTRGRLYREPFDRSGRLDREALAGLVAEASTPAAEPVQRPRLLVDFSELGDEEAEARLEAHVARAPEGAAAFRAQVAALGGPADELDGTPGSLDALARWLFEELPQGGTSAEGLAPDELPMQTPGEWRRQRRDEPADLPPWCASEAEEALSPLAPSELWLADGLGWYLAECITRELPGADWRVYRAASRRLRDVDENMPVLATGAGTFNAHSRAYTAVLLALAYRRHEPDLLRRVYGYALEALAS